MPPACDSTRPACDTMRACATTPAGTGTRSLPTETEKDPRHEPIQTGTERQDRAAKTRPRRHPHRLHGEAGPVATYPVADRKPTDAQFQALQDALAAAETSVDEKEQAWKLAIVERDAAEAAWDTGITARANYCESVTPNDLVALASTGLPLRSAPTPIGALPMPVNLQAKVSDYEGQIDLTCDAVTGAKTYEWQYRLHTEDRPGRACNRRPVARPPSPV